MDFSELHRFNDFMSKLKSLGDDEQALFAFLKDNQYLSDLAEGRGPLSRDGNIHLWLRKNWPLKDRTALQNLDGNLKDAANGLRMALSDPEGFGQGIPLFRWVKNLTDWADKFVVELNKFMTQMAPARFEYRNLRIANPDRMPEAMVRKLLNGVDYVIDLFKRRGVAPVLNDVFSHVILRHWRPEDGSVVGWYHPRTAGGEITITSAVLNQQQHGGRLLREWINEVFLHEVAHHIYFNVMDSAARKEWDSGWTPVWEATRRMNEAKEKARSVTFDERKRFWDMLLASKGDLKRIKLKGLDRMKFHAWLAEPQLGRSLVTPKNLKWTKDAAESFALFLSDPFQFVLEQYQRNNYGRTDIDEINKEVEERFERYKNRLGVAPSDTAIVWPRLSEEQVQEYAQQDSQIEKALDALEVPSQYARTDEKEDFAETFVAFLAAPEKLSKTAKYRMQRALHQSGMVGKPIMKTVASASTEHELQSSSAQAILRAVRSRPLDHKGIQKATNFNIRSVRIFVTRLVMLGALTPTSDGKYALAPRGQLAISGAALHALRSLLRGSYGAAQLGMLFR